MSNFSLISVLIVTVSQWLNGSSNRCPSCAAYCHPDTGVISLVPPASPTDPSQSTSHRGDNSNSTTRRASSRSRSSSSSSNSSSDSSCSTIQSTDSDDDRDHSLVGASFVSMESLSYLREVIGRIIQHFLDESPSDEISPSISLASYGQFESHAPHSSPPSDIYSTQSSPNDTINHSLRPRAADEEVAIAGRVAGKVLSIVALMLVFWVLTNWAAVGMMIFIYICITTIAIYTISYSGGCRNWYQSSRNRPSRYPVSNMSNENPPASNSETRLISLSTRVREAQSSSRTLRSSVQELRSFEIISLRCMRGLEQILLCYPSIESGHKYMHTSSWTFFALLPPLHRVGSLPLRMFHHIPRKDILLVLDIELATLFLRFWQRYYITSTKILWCSSSPSTKFQRLHIL